jgi:hypothetical protein
MVRTRGALAYRSITLRRAAPGTASLLIAACIVYRLLSHLGKHSEENRCVVIIAWSNEARGPETGYLDTVLWFPSEHLGNCHHLLQFTIHNHPLKYNLVDRETRIEKKLQTDIANAQIDRIV